MGEEAHPATTGQPIDLDEVIAKVVIVGYDSDRTSLAWHIASDIVPVLVAELRAARELYEAILDDTHDVSMRVDIALDAYEKAMGGQ